MKRWIPWLLAMALLLTGCGPWHGHTVPAREDSFTPDTALLTRYEQRQAYGTLSEDQRLNYSALYEAVNASAGTEQFVMVEEGRSRRESGVVVTLPVSLHSEDEVHELYEAFVNDNPQFFYLSRTYGFDGRQTGDTREFTTLKLVYYLSADRRVAAAAQLEQAVTELLGLLDESMDDFTRELTLHDALLARCSYDDAAADSEDPAGDHPAAFTAYGALVEGKAVCEGYSRAMQYLLHRVGLETAVVTGLDGDGQPHMWNMVMVNGGTYHLDATWDDNDEAVHHTYFNLTTADIRLTHTPDDHPWLEACTAEADNYFVRTGGLLSTLRFDEIAAVVTARLDGGNRTVELRFTTDRAYTNGLFFLRNAAWFCDTVNARLADDTPELTAYVCLTDDAQRTVTVAEKTQS